MVTLTETDIEYKISPNPLSDFQKPGNHEKDIQIIFTRTFKVQRFMGRKRMRKRVRFSFFLA